MKNSIKQRQSVSKINYKHGYANKEKLYNVWKSMKDRCLRKKYKHFKNYGGRGIKVCEEWKNDYINFRNWSISSGYQEGLTIERIDVNGNYEPSNCKWIPLTEQALNKRNTLKDYERQKECPICHKIFILRSRNCTKTCSRKCGVLLREITKKNKNKDKYKKECPICHKIFEDRSGHFKDSIHCSKKCANISKSPVWEFNGERLRVLEWADKLSLSAHCLHHRKEMGWTIEEILTIPKGCKRSKFKNE